MSDRDPSIEPSHSQQTLLQMGAVLAALAVVLMGAATQVWEFPKPRNDFGWMSMLCFVAALSFWMAHGAILHSALGPRFAEWPAIAFLFFGGMVAMFAIVTMLHRDIGQCLLSDAPICTQRSPGLTETR